MFFDGWVPILRVLLIGTLSSIAMAALLRLQSCFPAFRSCCRPEADLELREGVGMDDPLTSRATSLSGGRQG